MIELRVTENGVLLQAKIVTNAKSPSIAGVIGDRLKIRVSVPPEGGKANVSVCKLLADKLGVPVRGVTIVHGKTAQEKTVCIFGLPPEVISTRLGL